MVFLPEGKMKSREGTIVDADDLIEEVVDLAKMEVSTRHKELSDTDMEDRAESIGIGALKFFMVKIDPARDMVFDPKESISFEGETGPYVQYAHARIASIIRKYDEEVEDEFQEFAEEYKLKQKGKSGVFKSVKPVKAVKAEKPVKAEKLKDKPELEDEEEEVEVEDQEEIEEPEDEAEETEQEETEDEDAEEDQEETNETEV